MDTKKPNSVYSDRIFYINYYRTNSYVGIRMKRNNINLDDTSY